jgi:hypothetical protein
MKRKMKTIEYEDRGDERDIQEKEETGEGGVERRVIQFF